MNELLHERILKYIEEFRNRKAPAKEKETIVNGILSLESEEFEPIFRDYLLKLKWIDLFSEAAIIKQHRQVYEKYLLDEDVKSELDQQLQSGLFAWIVDTNKEDFAILLNMDKLENMANQDNITRQMLKVYKSIVPKKAASLMDLAIENNRELDKILEEIDFDEKKHKKEIELALARLNLNDQIAAIEDGSGNVIEIDEVTLREIHKYALSASMEALERMELLVCMAAEDGDDAESIKHNVELLVERVKKFMERKQ